jgi:transcriptional pleiotropic regulator of transition state genes
MVGNIFPTLNNEKKEADSGNDGKKILQGDGGKGMKATGMVRKMDPLGRVVLPSELRQVLDIKNGDALEIFIDGDKILFQKYEPGCIFCGEAQNISTFQKKLICRACLATIKTST